MSEDSNTILDFLTRVDGHDPTTQDTELDASRLYAKGCAACDAQRALLRIVRDLEAAEARVASLTQVAEAARRVLEDPWDFDVWTASAGHFTDAEFELRERLVAVDGLVGLHEQEQT